MQRADDTGERVLCLRYRKKNRRVRMTVSDIIFFFPKGTGQILINEIKFIQMKLAIDLKIIFFLCMEEV